MPPLISLLLQSSFHQLDQAQLPPGTHFATRPSLSRLRLQCLFAFHCLLAISLLISLSRCLFLLLFGFPLLLFPFFVAYRLRLLFFSQGPRKVVGVRIAIHIY